MYTWGSIILSSGTQPLFETKHLLRIWLNLHWGSLYTISEAGAYLGETSVQESVVTAHCLVWSGVHVYLYSE